MSTKTRTRIECDGGFCFKVGPVVEIGDTGSTLPNLRKTARLQAASLGWIRWTNLDLCPECAKLTPTALDARRRLRG